MTLGGLALVGLTVAIAAADEALATLLFAAAVGAGVYTLARRRSNALPAKILKIQKQALEDQVNSSDGDKNVKAEAAARREELEKVLESQRWGNQELAALSGIAAFAYPPLGVVALAVVSAPLWKPAVGGAISRMLAGPVPTPTKSPQGYFTRTGVLGV